MRTKITSCTRAMLFLFCDFKSVSLRRCETNLIFDVEVFVYFEDIYFIYESLYKFMDSFKTQFVKLS